MKNGQYFNFRDICNRNSWNTGYLVKKITGIRDIKTPHPPPPPQWRLTKADLRMAKETLERIQETVVA